MPDNSSQFCSPQWFFSCCIWKIDTHELRNMHAATQRVVLTYKCNNETTCISTTRHLSAVYSRAHSGSRCVSLLLAAVSLAQGFLCSGVVRWCDSPRAYRFHSKLAYRTRMRASVLDDDDVVAAACRAASRCRRLNQEKIVRLRVYMCVHVWIACAAHTLEHRPKGDRPHVAGNRTDDLLTSAESSHLFSVCARRTYGWMRVSVYVCNVGALL